VNQVTTLSPRGRLLWAAVGLALAALLATAWRLTPDPRGYGTHEQLGLASCGFTRITGYRCPGCGMTTAWAHVLDGDVRAAAAVNAGGALLSLASIVAAPWAVASAIAGRTLFVNPWPHLVLWIGTAWAAVALLDWARRLAVG
jgi:hypothetical protein